MEGKRPLSHDTLSFLRTVDFIVAVRDVRATVNFFQNEANPVAEKLRA